MTAPRPSNAAPAERAALSLEFVFGSAYASLEPTRLGPGVVARVCRVRLPPTRGRIEIGGTLDRYRRSRGRLTHLALDVDVAPVLERVRKALADDPDYTLDAWLLDARGARLAFSVGERGSLTCRVRPEGDRGAQLLLSVHEIVALDLPEAPAFAHALEALRRAVEHPLFAPLVGEHRIAVTTAGLRVPVADLAAAAAFLPRRWKLPSRHGLSVCGLTIGPRQWTLVARDAAERHEARADAASGKLDGARPLDAPLWSALDLARRADDHAIAGDREAALAAYRALSPTVRERSAIRARLLDALLLLGTPAAHAAARALAQERGAPLDVALVLARTTKGTERERALRAALAAAEDPLVAVQVRLAIARTMLETDPDAAMQSARECMIQAPRHTGAWSLLVASARVAGDVEALEEALGRIDDVPLPERIRVAGLGELVRILDRREDSRASTLSWAQEWARHAPRDARAAWYWARIAWRAERAAEAHAAIEHAIERALETADPALQLDVADDAERIAGDERARLLWRAASAELREGWLGLRQIDALRRLGEEGDAQRALERVVRQSDDPRVLDAARAAMHTPLSVPAIEGAPPNPPALPIARTHAEDLAHDANEPTTPPAQAARADVVGPLRDALEAAQEPLARADALTALAAALPNDERTPILAELGELLYFELENERDAYEPLIAAFEASPDALSYGALSALEDLAARRGDTQRLVAVYEVKLAQTRDPQMRNVFRLTMAESLLSVDPAAARRLTDDVLREAPRHPPALRIHARVLEADEDVAGAVRALEQALDSPELDDIERFDVWRDVARLDPVGDAGERANRALLEASPGDGQALSGLKRAYAERSDWAAYVGVLRREAETLLGEAAPSSVDATDARGWWATLDANAIPDALAATLVGVLREAASVWGGPLDDPGLACDLLRRALPLGESDPEFVDTLVWAAREAGDDLALADALERLAAFLLSPEREEALSEAAALRTVPDAAPPAPPGPDRLAQLDALEEDEGPRAALHALSEWLPEARDPALRRALLVRKGAWTLATSDEARDALLPLKGALILEPTSIETRALLLRTYALSDDGSAAMAQWRELCALAPEGMAPQDEAQVAESVALWLTRANYPGRDALLRDANADLSALVPDL